MKRWFKWILILMILALGLYGYLRVQLGPYGSGGVVYIPKGHSVAQMAQVLKEAGLLRNTWVFSLWVRWEGVAHKLQAGEYEFPAQVTPPEIVEKLKRGDRLRRYLTVVEGNSFTQIAAAMEKAGIAPSAEVQRAFRDPKYLSKLGFPAQSLEGYLFPESYEYDRGTTLESLLDTMIATFQKNYDEELRKRGQGAGWTIPQVVTLASIIEKETGLAAERPVISSVFHNRLKIGMPLQSDPTVIYGLKRFDGNIRKEDLRNPHPYNTYIHVGLPPGPIASPGKASLRAVLYPATTDYLFFVSKKDGSHHFSATLEEHNAAVQRYQLGKAPAPQPSPEPKRYDRPLMKPQPMPGVVLPTPSPTAEKRYDRPVMKPQPAGDSKQP
jgi:UPF0755 protein